MDPLRAFQDSILAQRVANRFAAKKDTDGKVVGKDPKAVTDWLSKNDLKQGQKVRVWTGRGKQDYHEGTVSNAKLWPEPGDKAFPRENFREDAYTIKFDRDPAYEGEPREAVLEVKRDRGDWRVSWGKGRERVYKLSLL